MSPINDIAHGLRRVGKLRLGEQVEATKQDGSPTTRPSKLETWRITSADEVVLQAVAAAYGGEVRPWENDGAAEFEVVTDTSALDVLIMPEADAFSQWYELWSGGGCQRRCDGSVEQLSGDACKCPADLQERAEKSKLIRPTACKPTTRVSVVLPRVPALGSWMVESHGYYAAKELGSTFALLDMAGARSRLLPARLRIEQRVSKKDGKTNRYGVPVLDIGLRFDDLLAGDALPPAGVDPSTGEITAGGDQAALPPAEPVTSTRQAAAKKAAAPRKSTTEMSRELRANDPMDDAELDVFKARIALLEPANRDLLRTMLVAAGIDWGAKRRRGEGPAIDKVLLEVEAKQAASWEDRRRRVFAALDAFDPNMRGDETVRHQFIKDATEDATESTKTLTEEQATAIIEAAGGAAADAEQQELAS